MKKFHGVYIFTAFFLCLSSGTLGYHYIEGWSLLDSLYMTVITITTVGFHEVRDLSDPGRIFTIFLIFAGFGICVYTLTSVTSLVLRGELLAWIRRYFMNIRVDLFNDHVIVCGYGRMGKEVTKQLERLGVPFVVIEKDPNKAPDLKEMVHPVIIGNSASEEILKKAAIKSSASLISVVSSDAENAFTVMTARRLMPDLHIVSRCTNPTSVPKLKLAGADQVISPFELSGHRMTQAALHPAMVEFVDFLEDTEEDGIEMADILVRTESNLVGKALSSTDVASLGVIVVGIKKADKSFSFNPNAATVIDKGDHLVVVGPKKQVVKVCDL